MNGTPTIRARTPNNGIYNRVSSWDHPNKTIVVKASDVGSWANLNQVEMVMHRSIAQSNLRIASMSTSGTLSRIVTQDPERKWVFYYGDAVETYYRNVPYYFENAYEFIDVPGEWYLNTTTNELFYKPRSGENMASVSVIAPKVERLVEMKGTVPNPIKNIQFMGISFQHSMWLAPSTTGFQNNEGDILDLFQKPLRT